MNFHQCVCMCECAYWMQDLLCIYWIVLRYASYQFNLTTCRQEIPLYLRLPCLYCYLMELVCIESSFPIAYFVDRRNSKIGDSEKITVIASSIRHYKITRWFDSFCTYNAKSPSSMTRSRACRELCSCMHIRVCNARECVRVCLFVCARLYMF